MATRQRQEWLRPMLAIAVDDNFFSFFCFLFVVFRMSPAIPLRPSWLLFLVSLVESLSGRILVLPLFLFCLCSFTSFVSFSCRMSYLMPKHSWWIASVCSERWERSKESNVQRHLGFCQDCWRWSYPHLTKRDSRRIGPKNNCYDHEAVLRRARSWWRVNF